jgi:amidase
LQLALSVLAGPDERWAGIGYRLDLPPPRHERLADYRVLVLTDHPLCATAVSVSSAILALAENLTKAGCTVTHSHSDMPDLAQTTRVYCELLMAAIAPDLPPEQRARMATIAEGLSPEDDTLVAARLRGATMSHASWAHTSPIRASLRARWQTLLQSVDIIICPPMPTPAFPHDHSPFGTRQLDVDGRKINYDNQLAWSGIATMCGLPATAAPIGQSGSGLPVGVQIIGGYLRDRDTIAFATLAEREFGGFRRPPDFT